MLTLARGPKDNPGLQATFYWYGRNPTTWDRQLNARLLSKGLETIKTLTRLSGLTPPGVQLTREKS